MKEWMDTFSDSLSKTGKKAIKKTKDFSELSKLNLEINEEEDKMKEIYQMIGMKYYEQQAKHPPKEYEELFMKITHSQLVINQQLEKITRIKGIRICPRCGAKVETNAIFCWSCGVNIIQHVQKS